MVGAFTFVCVCQFKPELLQGRCLHGRIFKSLQGQNWVCTLLCLGFVDFFFFFSKIQTDKEPRFQPPSVGLSSGNAQPSLPILWLKKLPVGIDDLLWGLSIIPPLCPAVTSIRIWLTEEAWVICKEQQGFSFIILVGGQGANDWAWITRQCGIQGRKKPNRLPNEEWRGCRWKVPG